MEEQYQGGKESCIGIIVLISIVCFFAFKSGCSNESKDGLSLNENEVTTVEPSPKLDTFEIKRELVRISILVDENNIAPNKTFQQFSRVLNAYSNFSSSKYNVYKSAKIAKSAAEIAHDNIYNLELSDVFPETTKDSLRTVLEYISTCYSNMSSAFNIAMEMANDKADMSSMADYEENISKAPELYLAGLAGILQIQIGYGMTQKEINKIRAELKK